MKQLLALSALVCLLAGTLPAQQPCNVNLLANPDFESGDAAGWTMTRGTLGVGRYGDLETPGLGVSTLINGGSGPAHPLSLLSPEQPPHILPKLLPCGGATHQAL